MNPVVLLASLLALHPVLDEPTDLRLVATGTGDDPVTWTLGGEDVAVTGDGEAARIPVPAGEHTVQAATDHEGTWRALVRPDPSGPGVAYVDGWSAVHTPTPSAGDPWWPPLDPVPVALGAMGLVLLLVPRRRPKRP